MQPENPTPQTPQPVDRPEPLAPQPPQNGPQVIGPQGFGGNPTTGQAPDLSGNSAPKVFHTDGLPGQSPEAFSANVQQPKKRLRINKKIFAILIVVFLFLGGGGAFAYYTIQNNRPEKVLADALSNTMTDLLDRKPSSAIGSLKYEFKGDDSATVTIDYTSKMDGDNYHNEATLKAKYGDTEFSMNGSIIGVGTDAVYVKFDNLQKTIDQLTQSNPEYSTLSDPYKVIIQKIDGNWIKIDKESLVEYGFVQSEEEVDKCTTAVTNLRISEGDQKELKTIFLNNQFAIASEKLDSEDVDGESSYHYKLDFNEEASIEFTKAVINLESFKTVKDDCKLSTEDYDKQLQSLKENSEQSADEVKPVIELWVGSKTRRPTKLKVTMDDSSLTMEFISTIKINGEGISVQAPEESINLKDLKADIEATFGSAFAGVETRSDDTERQTDIKSLHGQLEAFYAQNGYYPTLASMNDATFRAENLQSLDEGAFKDPEGIDGTLVSEPIAGFYSYKTSDCSVSECASYTLTATLTGEIDGSSVYIKQSLNSSVQSDTPTLSL